MSTDIPMQTFDPHGIWQEQPLPWQSQAFSRLVQMLHDGRLPHALLLTGAKGSGKSVFAGALAAAVLCRQQGATACGSCEGCALAAGGGHGDFRWLAPEEGKRAIGIDQVRQAIRFVQQTAGYGDSKVLVVSPAEAMTTAAANALLKTLEEPAGSSHLLLVSHRPGDLPATVRSRCQSIVLPAPDRESACAWLEQGLEATSSRCLDALEATNDRVLEAYDLLLGEGIDNRLLLRSTLGDLMKGRIGASGAATALTKFDVELVLETGAALLASWLRVQGRDSLRVHARAFDSLMQLQRWLAATRRGVNLGRDMLLGEMCRGLERIVV